MTKAERQDSGLTDDQIKAEEEFMEGIPRMNWGAFFAAPIWGPAHGIWVTILLYPVWVFIDSLIYAAYTNPSPLSIILAVVAVAILIGVMVAFGILSQPQSWHRAAVRGTDKETFLRHERIWAVAGIIIAIAVIALATWYNLTIRPTLG